METTAHHSTVELANCKLNLRSDLSFHLQDYQGAACYLIEDEFNSRFFRVGISEYNFISMLDGSTTVSKAVAQNAANMGDKALSEHDAITICKWLIDSNLATTAVSRSAGRLIESNEKSAARKAIAKLNPVTPKIPLFNPDRVLGVLNQTFGWLFSLPAFIVWLAVVATGVFHVWSNWDLASSSASTVFARDNWLWLGITWILLKFFHECAHGIVCKKFGGQVRQAGLVLILLIPLPFVDVTSAWRIPSKWQRIFISAAGMYIEIFLAAIAALVWCNTQPGVLNQQAFNVMLAGSFTTLLFNANPLMRFDGYYMLADWLEMPNLGSHGQQLMKWAGKKFYLGQDVKKPSWPEGRGFIVGLYAILALAWKVLICVALVTAAEVLFFGLGIVLAFLAFGMWVIWPILKLLKYVFIGEETQQRPSRVRFCGMTAALALGGYFIFAFVPWYARIDAPAIVSYETMTEVRTSVPGFVEEIHVTSDQHVRAGDVFATLKNEELDADVEQLRLEMKNSDLRARQFKEQQLIAAYTVELNNFASIRKRLNERLEQQENLQIKATMDGQVVADDLESLIGTYLGSGHQLCGLGSSSGKKIEALVAQHDFDRFVSRSLENPKIRFRIWGTGTGFFRAKLEKVNPRAQTQLPHAAFSSTVGGELPVRFKPPSEGSSSSDEQFELVNPRFLATVKISKTDSKQLRAGQTGRISFRASRGSVGDVLCETVVTWFRKIREQNHAQLQ